MTSDATSRIGDVAMLAKCSNPSCSARFLRLGNGRLFILEADPPRHTDKSERPEYFWLCDACSAMMTLRLVEDARVVAVPFAGRRRKLSYGVSLASRDTGKGLLLHCVSLLSEHLDDSFGDSAESKTVSCMSGMECDEETAADAICPVPE